MLLVRTLPWLQCDKFWREDYVFLRLHPRPVHTPHPSLCPLCPAHCIPARHLLLCRKVGGSVRQGPPAFPLGARVCAGSRAAQSLADMPGTRRWR